MSGPCFRASERPEPVLVRAPLGLGLRGGGVRLGVAGCCLWLALGGDLGGGLRPLGWVALLVACRYGLPGAWVLVRALLRLPLLRADESGLRTSWARDAAGLVPWEEVLRVRPRRGCFVVLVASSDAVLHRAPAHRRRTLGRRRGQHGTPVTIATRPLEPRVPETLTLLHHWRDHMAWRRDREARGLA